MNSRLEERLGVHFQTNRSLLPPDALVSRVLDIPATHPEASAPASRLWPHVQLVMAAAPVGLVAAAVIGIALFTGFFSSAPLRFGGDATPVSTPTQAPTPQPLAVAGGDAYRLAEGDGPGGRWSYWVWTAHCGPSGLTVLYQWIEYAPLRGGVGIDLEQCHGGDSRVQPYVVERSGVGDDGWSFLYGQTQLDVVRVEVRLADGREYETETLAAPGGLNWDARFYVMLLPVDHGQIDTVRGYDASGQDVGGDFETGEGAP